MKCRIRATFEETPFSEFGSAETLRDQKKAFFPIQLWQGETTPAIAERFYLEDQVLDACGSLNFADAVTAAVSAVALQNHFQLYLKGICQTPTSFLDIKEAPIEIPLNLL